MIDDGPPRDLLALLDDTVRAVTEHPDLADGLPVTDVVVQHPNGHILLPCSDDTSPHGRAWVFVDLGTVLSVVTVGWRGHLIDPTHARALGEALTAWADRKDPRPA